MEESLDKKAFQTFFLSGVIFLSGVLVAVKIADDDV